MHVFTHTRSTSDVPVDGRSSTRDTALALYVVATTEAGTRAALAAGRDLSSDLNPRIVLLVPHIVPYAQPLDHPADSVAFTENRFRRLAAEAGIDVFVRICVCRSDDASLERLLAQDATVLVGGTRRSWWHTGEERLATRLHKHGHRVLFIDATPPSADRSMSARPTSFASSDVIRVPLALISLRASTRR